MISAFCEICLKMGECKLRVNAGRRRIEVYDMRFRIGIADLAANALIEALKLDEGRDFLSFQEIEAYGCEVVNILKASGQEAVLILSREHTERFLHDYSDFFTLTTRANSIEGLELAEGKNRSDLIQAFRGYLALDVLRAFVSKTSVDVLRGSYDRV